MPRASIQAPNEPDDRPTDKFNEQRSRLQHYGSTVRPVRTPKLLCPDPEEVEEGMTSAVTMPTGHELTHDGKIIHQVDPTGTVHKIVAYDPEVVLGWNTLWSLSMSVFTKPITLQTITQSAMIGICVAIVTVVLPSGRTLKTTQINYLVNFMMVFLAFITGIFVNASFQRWQTLVQHLGALFRAIKALHNDLEAMGSPAEHRRRIKRWGLLSVWLTAFEAPENWERCDWQEKFEMIQSFGYVTNTERDFLLTADAKASIPWSWCTMTIKELSDKEFLPPKSSPSFVMLLNNVDLAETSIQSIDQLCLLQMPYQYVHMLAWLIHAFNIVNAIRCGIEIGIIGSQIWSRQHGYTVPTAQQSQALFTYTLIMMLAPTIYQAFLTIALDIAIPFGNGDTDLPIVYLIDRFANELADLEEHEKILSEYRA